MNPYVSALVYAAVALAVIPIGFEVFKTHYRFSDVVLAALCGAALSLIPVLGGIASYAGTVLVLYWRNPLDVLVPDIVTSVAVARLATLPALLALLHR
jgi:predicted PurR-regulated permease PerM